jgi:hypothetical protein
MAGKVKVGEAGVVRYGMVRLGLVYGRCGKVGRGMVWEVRSGEVWQVR